MIVKYRAFSWTYTPEQLQKVLIENMSEALSRGIKYTEAKLAHNPDRAEALVELKKIKEDLDAGLESPAEWLDTVAWSWLVEGVDPRLGSGAYGQATYYAKIKDYDVPEDALGKTQIVIDRPNHHLDLTIDVIS